MLTGAAIYITILLAAQLSLTAMAAPVGRGPQPALNRLTAATAARLLRGNARQEWEALDEAARQGAGVVLDHSHITEADVDTIHFDATGHVFIADTFSGAGTVAGGRTRRSISGSAPSGLAASG